MKYLYYFNAVVLALAATFAITMGVVTLLYWVHMDSSPRIRSEWASVRDVTLVFAVLLVLAATAYWGLRHQRRWFIAAETVLLAGLLGAAVAIRALVTG